MIWTGKKIKQLRELYQNYDRNECAELMGIPVGCIKYAIQRFSIKTSRTGRFGSDNLPPKTKGNGSISIRADVNGNYYKYIRISPGNWELLHRHNWEKKYGKIPADKILVSKDSDSMNCDTDHWKLISRAEHARRNSNSEKTSKTMKTLYRRERIRKLYDLPPLSNLTIDNY